MMQGFGQSVGSLMMILAVVIAILWIALPFAAGLGMTSLTC